MLVHKVSLSVNEQAQARAAFVFFNILGGNILLPVLILTLLSSDRLRRQFILVNMSVLADYSWTPR